MYKLKKKKKQRKDIKKHFIHLLRHEVTLDTTVQWFGFQQGSVNKEF